jgi:hypothetical protein
LPKIFAGRPPAFDGFLSVERAPEFDADGQEAVVQRLHASVATASQMAARVAAVACAAAASGPPTPTGATGCRVARASAFTWVRIVTRVAAPGADEERQGPDGSLCAERKKV